MTAIWISLAVAFVLLLAWRLRRAATLVDKILREERAVTERQAGTGAGTEVEARDDDRTEHPKR